MGAGRPLLDLDDRRGPATEPSPARSLQCLALVGPSRCTMALAAERLAAVASGLPTDATLAARGRVRSLGSGPAGGTALGGRAHRRTVGGHLRQPHHAE